jgi:anti-sigma factor RsiW
MSKQKKTSIRKWLKGFMLKHMHKMMTCKEFEDFVQAYIDDELSSAQRSVFELHIRLCRECKDYLAAYQRAIALGRAVLGAPNQPVPAEVPKDLVAAILKAKENNNH